MRKFVGVFLVLAALLALSSSSAWAVEPVKGPSNPPNCLGEDVSGLAEPGFGEFVSGIASDPAGGDGAPGIGGEVQLHRAGVAPGVSCS